jgi:hypothetical protein
MQGGTRGESGRGWCKLCNGIQEGLLCALPFEGFDYGGVNIKWCDVLSCSTSPGASGGGTGWCNEGVIQLTWAQTVHCTALLGAHLVAVAGLTKQGRWDLTQGLSGHKNGMQVGFGNAARL